MIKNKLISKLNYDRLESYLKNPGIPLIIYGEKYLYIELILNYLAQKVLSLNNLEFKTYPYLLKIKPIDNKIGIDQIKEINKFIELKVPSQKDFNRIILIFSSNKMTIEAQNAFLKNLEEPPMGTIYLSSSNDLNKMLTTIKSRCLKIRIVKPTEQEIIDYYKHQGYKIESIKKAINISNSLPKLLNKILENKNDEIDEKVKIAKQIISSDSFNRLKLVDTLNKDKDSLKDILYIVKQMSKFGILSKSFQESKQWLNILSRTIDAEYSLEKQVQIKTVLSDYFLNI